MVTRGGQIRRVHVQEAVGHNLPEMGQKGHSGRREHGDDRLAASQRPIVGHCPSGAGWASTSTTTSSSRPFRTAQTTSSCFVLMPSLSCMR